MALCVISLVDAGLLIRSSLNVSRAPIGINPSNVLTVQICLPEAKYRGDEDQVAFHNNSRRGSDRCPE
jgi:hypothetical protein